MKTSGSKQKYLAFRKVADDGVLIQAVIFSVPEAIAITWLACALAGSGCSWKRILIIGGLMGVFSVLVRPLVGNYLLNVVVYAGTLIAMMTMFKVAELWENLTSVSIAMPIYMLLEFLNISVWTEVFGVEPAAIMKGQNLRLLCFLPQLSASLLIALLLTKYQVSLFSDETGPLRPFAGGR
jgi:hypothetical protein